MVAVPPSLNRSPGSSLPDDSLSDSLHSSTAEIVKARPIPAPVVIRPPLAVAVARRAVPFVTAAASAALTTLAVERAVANLALRSIERTPFARRPAPPEFTRVTVTHTTIVERITRPA